LVGRDLVDTSRVGLVEFGAVGLTFTWMSWFRF